MLQALEMRYRIGRKYLKFSKILALIAVTLKIARLIYNGQSVQRESAIRLSLQAGQKLWLVVLSTLHCQLASRQ